MNDLLKEAIADAKAVRETALANAKVALEEAFTPRLQSMLSAKLSEEEGMEDEPEAEIDMEVPAEEPAMEDEMPMETAEDEMPTEGDYSDDTFDRPVAETEDMDDPVAEEDDNMELEAIIKELELEVNEEEDTMDDPVTEGDDDEMKKEEKDDEMKTEGEKSKDDMDEEISLDEIINALREEEGDDDTTNEEEKDDTVKEEKDDKDLKEAYNVIKFLKSKINEVNLLNAKLLFSNKLFRNYPLSESQKMKVIENFDRASNLREVKLIFSTLCESFTSTKTKRSIKESYASKPSRSTAPKKEILSEGNQLAARWKKLANLK